MGKSDKVQAKLQFKSRKAHKERSEGVAMLEEALEGAMDVLMYRMDRMLDRLDGHTECLDQLEWRVSEPKDEHGTLEIAQKKVDKFLLM
ncbi:hypothetical protein NDU88_003959 [Pleurodeles waltl]|uniref:Uncharacterized protein n=1 Tax=Pleurodeles waltl TaxID=8319 RepID=A0AAV7W8G1_PLEWA|nr:hypothetical protein NDU88_003959 [Pleurodeles waltl]